MSSDDLDPPTEAPSPEETSSPASGGGRLTRASAAWVAVGIGLVLLILLIVFMLQNSTKVEVDFLAWTGTIPLGMSLLIAAVSGGVVVAIAGAARVTQLRRSVRRTKRGITAD